MISEMNIYISAQIRSYITFHKMVLTKYDPLYSIKIQIYIIFLIHYISNKYPIYDIFNTFYKFKFSQNMIFSSLLRNNYHPIYLMHQISKFLILDYCVFLMLFFRINSQLYRLNRIFLLLMNHNYYNASYLTCI